MAICSCVLPGQAIQLGLQVGKLLSGTFHMTFHNDTAATSSAAFCVPLECTDREVGAPFAVLCIDLKVSTWRALAGRHQTIYAGTKYIEVLQHMCPCGSM